MPTPATDQDQPGQREDVERVCAHLADKIAEIGFPRPAVSRAWRRAARLLIDHDTAPAEDAQGRIRPEKVTEDTVRRVIDSAMADPFWGGRGNIRSMPTLRRHFATLTDLRRRATAA